MAKTYKNVIQDRVKTEAEVLAAGANSIIKGQQWLTSDTKEIIHRDLNGNFEKPNYQIKSPADGVVYGLKDGALVEIDGGGAVTVSTYAEFKTALLGTVPFIQFKNNIIVDGSDDPTIDCQFLVDNCDKYITGNIEITDTSFGTFFFASIGEPRKVFQYGQFITSTSKPEQYSDLVLINFGDDGYEDYVEIDWYAEELLTSKGRPVGSAKLHFNRYVNSSASGWVAEEFESWIDPWNNSNIMNYKYGDIGSGNSASVSSLLQKQLVQGVANFSISEIMNDAYLTGELNFGGFNYTFNGNTDKDGSYYAVLNLQDATLKNTRSEGYYPGTLRFDTHVKVKGLLHICRYNDDSLGWGGGLPKFMGNFNCEIPVTLKGSDVYIDHIKGTELIADDVVVKYQTKDDSVTLTELNGGSFVQEFWKDRQVATLATLAEVLANGNSAGDKQIKDLAVGVDPADAVRLSQLHLPATGQAPINVDANQEVSLDFDGTLRLLSGKLGVEASSVNHNSLDGLEGGQADEYNHLTDAELSDLHKPATGQAPIDVDANQVVSLDFDSSLSLDPETNELGVDVGSIDHQSLNNLQGGSTLERNHLTNVELAKLNSLTTDHNELDNLQGGLSSDYQHLNSAQVTKLNNLTDLHNELSALQGGSSSERYHLTLADVNKLNLTLVSNFAEFQTACATNPNGSKGVFVTDAFSLDGEVSTSGRVSVWGDQVSWQNGLEFSTLDSSRIDFHNEVGVNTASGVTVDIDSMAVYIETIGVRTNTSSNDLTITGNGQFIYETSTLATLTGANITQQTWWNKGSGGSVTIPSSFVFVDTEAEFLAAMASSDIHSIWLTDVVDVTTSFTYSTYKEIYGSELRLGNMTITAGSANSWRCYNHFVRIYGTVTLPTTLRRIFVLRIFLETGYTLVNPTSLTYEDYYADDSEINTSMPQEYWYNTNKNTGGGSGGAQIFSIDFAKSATVTNGTFLWGLSSGTDGTVATAHNSGVVLPFACKLVAVTVKALNGTGDGTNVGLEVLNNGSNYMNLTGLTFSNQGSAQQVAGGNLAFGDRLSVRTMSSTWSVAYPKITMFFEIL